jgi:hypothetical protein
MSSGISFLLPLMQFFKRNNDDPHSRYASTEETTETVLISAHYDSRGTFGSTRAPGANDDGSGITGLLGIARTIKRFGITFRTNVELVAFAGEEQGLYGSRYYAGVYAWSFACLVTVIPPQRSCATRRRI